MKKNKMVGKKQARGLKETCVPLKPLMEKFLLI